MINEALSNSHATDSHWIMNIEGSSKTYQSHEYRVETKIARKIISEKNANYRNTEMPISLAFFDVAGMKDLSSIVQNFVFSSISDKRLDGWNGLFHYPEKDRERMLNYYIPRSQHEHWHIANKLHKQLVKDDVKNLTKLLTDFRND